MSIIIESIIEPHSDECFCSVRYGDQTIACHVHGDEEDLSSRIGKTETVEFDYKGILKTSILPHPDGIHCSGLHQTLPSVVSVIGTVHGSTELESGTVLYEIYVMKGADSLCVSSDDISVVLSVGDSVSLEVSGFKAFPTNT